MVFVFNTCNDVYNRFSSACEEDKSVARSISSPSSVDVVLEFLPDPYLGCSIHRTRCRHSVVISLPHRSVRRHPATSEIDHGLCARPRTVETCNTTEWKERERKVDFHRIDRAERVTLTFVQKMRISIQVTVKWHRNTDRMNRVSGCTTTHRQSLFEKEDCFGVSDECDEHSLVELT